MNLARMHKLTRDLIAIDSVSGNEEAVTQFLQTVLRGLGMRVRPLPVSAERCNLLAGWDEPVRVLFNTHVDTVPPQYGPHEDDERIYGRGACDTHGILAAQLEALLDLHEAGHTGLGLLLVVGEETSHDGARAAATSPELAEPEVLIVGEPTQNKLMTYQKGRLKGDLFAYGVEGHSGYPEHCDSAVEKLVRALEALWRAPWLARHSEQGTTVNVTIKQGGPVDNQVPGVAQARLVFRCAEPCAEVRRRTARLVEEVAATLSTPPGDRPHFELLWDPAENDPITHLATLPGFETGTAAYNTDIAYFGWHRARTFLVGPGSILQAHKDLRAGDWLGGEWISKQEQVEGVAVYKKLVQALL